MSRYWLTSKDKLEDPEAYEEAIREICRLYADAPGLYEQGIIVVSTDERTGIQALERLFPTLPMKPGSIERREFEYKRHGTLLTVNYNDLMSRQENYRHHMIMPKRHSPGRKNKWR